ncbi:MAG: cytochrome c1 [Nevskia sp.]
MKRILSSLTLVLASLSLAGIASANEVELKNFRPDYGNVASMQRGARDFMAYCSGCHAMKYLRYARMAEDLKIPEDLLKANLMFGTDKVGETIKVAMPAASEQWFGRVPPDLSLEARARGADWIYTYLQSFYLDDKRPLGVNNSVLPGASMPHVLWELQGWQKKAGHPEGAAAEGEKAEQQAAEGEHHGGFEQVTQGSLSPEEYRDFVADLTNFMDYAAEPGKRDRIHTGFKVLLFLLLLLILTYLLKKEFWKDIH